VSTVIGRGWATVELDRAAGELADLLDEGAAFADAPRSALLGARCRVGRARAGDGAARWIVLLEPDTEGRVAAFLARAGEGWAADWDLDEPPDQDVGVAGPLGEERLAERSRPAGPFRLRLAAATIEP
jgi:hypothetical protein